MENLEFKSVKTELKNWLEGLNSRPELTEEKKKSVNLKIDQKRWFNFMISRKKKRRMTRASRNCGTLLIHLHVHNEMPEGKTVGKKIH